ncbi:hypothetical protein Vretifemale_34 [Volvox reticuliferus]|uniref:Uncharacterized protein n=1 Tax=Volvox reticuliferus TaxID=1737510 RepID=A0A8J4BXG7_9CHLO|nr:hypothetical protein Vretifemale_34 [Volvox reticuliferus]
MLCRSRRPVIPNGGSGCLKPGRMCLLLGSSGTGRITLNQVLLARQLVPPVHCHNPHSRHVLLRGRRRWRPSLLAWIQSAWIWCDAPLEGMLTSLDEPLYVRKGDVLIRGLRSAPSGPPCGLPMAPGDRRHLVWDYTMARTLCIVVEVEIGPDGSNCSLTCYTTCVLGLRRG